MVRHAAPRTAPSARRVEPFRGEVAYQDDGFFLRGPLDLDLGSALERCLRPVQIASAAGPATIEPPSVEVVDARLLGQNVILVLEVGLPHGPVGVVLELSHERFLLMVHATESRVTDTRALRKKRD